MQNECACMWLWEYMYFLNPKQEAQRLKEPLETLERDMESFEGNLRRSGELISRMREQTSKLNVYDPRPSSSQVAQFEGASKSGSKGDEPLKFFPYENAAKSQAPVQVTSGDDGCTFARTPAGTSADVKVCDCNKLLVWRNSSSVPNHNNL